MSNNWLKYLVALAAILIAGSAAYFSVTGLGVLFSGAAIAVMVMASSLEFAKLVTATYLKQEWDQIKGLNKWYLTSAVVILMAITSAGIFGYLSNAFQQQNLKLGQIQREIDVWDNKIKLTNDQILTLQNQQKDLSNTQNTLITKGKVNSRLIRSADNRDKQSTKISNRINSLQDSIVVYNGKINEIKNNNIDIEREVGGFRFVADAFGVELNSVVKFFIILIVIVFDPLAVALIISFNQLVIGNKRKEDNDETQPTIGPSTNPEDLKEFIDETVRLKLSQEDINKLESILLNPPQPNQKLKDAAQRYSDEVREKHIPIKDDDEILKRADDIRMRRVFERMEEIEKIRESIHGPILPEDEPVGALANSGIREKLEREEMERDEEPYAGPIEMSIDNEVTTNSNNTTETTEQSNDDFSDWDVTLMDGLEDEPPFFTEEELQEESLEVEENENFSTIEPTEEEENENFSTIEPNSENIFQDNQITPSLSDEEVHDMFMDEWERKFEMVEEDNHTETFTDEFISDAIDEFNVESLLDEPVYQSETKEIDQMLDIVNNVIDDELNEVQTSPEEDDEKKN